MDRQKTDTDASTHVYPETCTSIELHYTCTQQAHTHAHTYIGDVSGDEGQRHKRPPDEGLREAPHGVDVGGQLGRAVALEEGGAPIMLLLLLL